MATAAKDLSTQLIVYFQANPRSKSKVARELGINRGTLTNYINGTKNPRGEQLRKVLDLLGSQTPVSVGELQVAPREDLARPKIEQLSFRFPLEGFVVPTKESPLTVAAKRVADVFEIKLQMKLVS